MKILYYDCFSGISGDMNLGAMIDLGVNPEILLSKLGSLNLPGWKISIGREQRHGITGTKVTVHTEGEPFDGHETDSYHDHEHDHHHSHDHSHNHSHGDDAHEHEHDHDHHHGHHHDHHHGHAHVHGHEHETTHRYERNLKDISTIINSSPLDLETRNLALKIFRVIAEAEAHVHGKPVDEVHFHEVGAVDSIIDIVGAAICFRELEVDKVYVSPVELGSGMVRCAHGLLPVPAPATVRIMRGFPVTTGGVNFEAATPTGAAIVAALAEPAPAGFRFTINSTGYGIGHKNNPDRPNILRVHLGEADEEGKTGHQAFMAECNIDDMNPELFGYISGRLFDAGARDVFYTAITMKKGRPAFTVSVICEEEDLPAVKNVLFTETTTIGLRISPFIKETLEREFSRVDTPFGTVTVKKSFYRGKLVSAKPEADECEQIAKATGLPMKQVMSTIQSLITIE